MSALQWDRGDCKGVSVHRDGHPIRATLGIVCVVLLQRPRDRLALQATFPEASVVAEAGEAAGELATASWRCTSSASAGDGGGLQDEGRQEAATQAAGSTESRAQGAAREDSDLQVD